MRDKLRLVLWALRIDWIVQALTTPVRDDDEGPDPHVDIAAVRERCYAKAIAIEFHMV